MCFNPGISRTCPRCLWIDSCTFPGTLSDSQQPFTAYTDIHACWKCHPPICGSCKHGGSLTEPQNIMALFPLQSQNAVQSPGPPQSLDKLLGQVDPQDQGCQYPNSPPQLIVVPPLPSQHTSNKCIATRAVRCLPLHEDVGQLPLACFG